MMQNSARAQPETRALAPRSVCPFFAPVFSGIGWRVQEDAIAADEKLLATLDGTRAVLVSG